MGRSDGKGWWTSLGSGSYEVGWKISPCPSAEIYSWVLVAGTAFSFPLKEQGL